MREVELKFAVPVAFALPSALPLDAGVASIDELPPLDLRSTYHDTEDLRLVRSGITLRHRRGDPETEGWDLKIPVRTSEVLERDELHFDGPRNRIPEEARDLVMAFARRGRLTPIATLRTRRSRWSLKDEAGADLAIAYLDEVSVLEGNRVVSRFRELEIEAVAADTGTLESIGSAMTEAGAGVAEPIPKVVRALGPRAASPPELAPSKVAPSDPAGTAFKSALAASLNRLIQHDPIARIGSDPEGVHQMRVAARRIRSDLRTFGPLLDPEWSNSLKDELKWLGDALGAVRDLDVLISSLSESAGELQPELRPFFEDLSEKRSAARDALLGSLRADRYLSLLDRLFEAAAEPRLTKEAHAPCKAALPSLVAAQWSELAKRARDALGDDPTDEQLHDVRIRVKRARYAAEAVAGALGSDASDARRFAKLASKLQDTLGAHQDSVIAREVIRAFAATRARNGALNLAAGQLIERQRRVSLDARAMFRRQWEQLDRKKVRAWVSAKTST